MKILISLLSLSLLSFTAAERTVTKNETKLKTLPAPSDSLSLKNLRLTAKKIEDKKAIVAPVKTSSSKTVSGIASFYSANLEGSKTATGERFSHSKSNIASNFFKLNTWVRVTSINNGKSIIARVNDRMHPRMAARGRVVDLTSNHAKKLGFYKNGLGKVKVEEVPAGTQE